MKTNSINKPTRVCKGLFLLITLVFLLGNVNGIGQALSEPESIPLTSQNTMPYADDQAVSVAEDGSVAITLTGGDIDGDALEFYVFEGPLHGTLSGNAPYLTYTPDADYNGSDSFIFAIYDGFPEAASAEGLVSITVLPMNDMAYANDQVVSVTEGGSVAIELTGGDIDGDELEFYIFEGPLHGMLSGDAPYLTYTPDVGYIGSDSFIFAVYDGYPEAASAEGLVSITVISENNIPIAYSRFIRTAKNRPVSIVLTGSDLDNDSLTYMVINPPVNGSLSGSGPDLIYTPVYGFTGDDAFSFIVNDGKADSLPATIRIVVSSLKEVIVIWGNLRPNFGGTQDPSVRIQQ